jgi:hypothetical protein
MAIPANLALMVSIRKMKSNGGTAINSCGSSARMWASAIARQEPNMRDLMGSSLQSLPQQVFRYQWFANLFVSALLIKCFASLFWGVPRHFQSNGRMPIGMHVIAAEDALGHTS